MIVTALETGSFDINYDISCAEIAIDKSVILAVCGNLEHKRILNFAIDERDVGTGEYCFFDITVLQICSGHEVDIIQLSVFQEYVARALFFKLTCIGFISSSPEADAFEHCVTCEKVLKRFSFFVIFNKLIENVLGGKCRDIVVSLLEDRFQNVNPCCSLGGLVVVKQRATFFYKSKVFGRLIELKLFIRVLKLSLSADALRDHFIDLLFSNPAPPNGEWKAYHAKKKKADVTHDLGALREAVDPGSVCRNYFGYSDKPTRNNNRGEYNQDQASSIHTSTFISHFHAFLVSHQITHPISLSLASADSMSSCNREAARTQ